MSKTGSDGKSAFANGISIALPVIF